MALEGGEVGDGGDGYEAIAREGGEEGRAAGGEGGVGEPMGGFGLGEDATTALGGESLASLFARCYSSGKGSGDDDALHSRCDIFCERL